MPIGKREPYCVVADRIDRRYRHIDLAGDGYALIAAVPLNFRRRAENPEIFGRKLEIDAIVEADRQCFAVFRKPNFSGPRPFFVGQLTSSHGWYRSNVLRPIPFQEDAAL